MGSEALLIQRTGDTVGAVPVPVHLKDLMHDGRFFRHRFQGKRLLFALFDLNLTISVGGCVSDEIPVLYGQQAAVVHDALGVLQELVPTL